MAQVSQAQETLIVSMERLALARLALEGAKVQGVHDPPRDDLARKGTSVRKTIQELREAQGESRANLAAAIGVTLDEVTDWETGRAEPGIARVRILSEHFGVRDDEITLKPGQEPTLGERLADAL
jgi:DNA-binding transcriptional regulator YiaG